ncbi:MULTISPECIES: PDDEXK family nuclease [Shewanella]|uniref:hypothetical protein n=1 Tax=Shewanella TaxID=22 RepID=UPI0004D7197F|nr:MULTISPECIES: hypothetical protein [Shewanella]KEK27058.1 hypothetical protein SXM_3356 [Shewanella xiamenensis]NSM23113.1 hypothetical protein [Shewanella sp. ZOR0012]
MKIQIARNDLFIPETIKSKIFNYVSEALNSITTQNNQFIVNDTLCFRKQGRGNKVTPCVMNSASYMSSIFQESLASLPNCYGETTINNQSFDGMIHIDYDGFGFEITEKDNILKVTHQYIYINKLPSNRVYTLFPMFYGMFVDRSFFDINFLPEYLHHFFTKKSLRTTIKVGVEFETGNIASSFRAINKLYGLYQSGFIDIGVLVTSIDKPNCATRIWPVSNRNGSFQELNQRNYEEQVSLPLIGVGFSPDSFSNKAPFFDATGSLYYLTYTGSISDCGIFKKYIGNNSEEILIPIHS